MRTDLTVLTTADADEAVMELFAEVLANSELGEEKHVTWLVVDGLLAYPEPLKFSGENPLLERRWITPSVPLPQLEAIMHGLLMTQGTVIIMDPDMSGNIKDIPDFVTAHRNGTEIVFGKRILRHGISPLRQFFTASYNSIARGLLSVPIHDLNTPMLSVTQNVVDLIKAVPPGCPSPRFYVFNRLRNGLGEVSICVSELSKKSSYSPLARASLGMRTLAEILGFIFWMRKARR